jgi:hypothetical protein
MSFLVADLGAVINNEEHLDKLVTDFDRDKLVLPWTYTARNGVQVRFHKIEHATSGLICLAELLTPGKKWNARQRGLRFEHFDDAKQTFDWLV